MTALRDAFRQLLDLGGPVVVLIAAISVLALAVILGKALQLFSFGTGRHRLITLALAAWDQGNGAAARAHLARSGNALGPLLSQALGADPALRARYEGLAEARLDRLDRGMRFLDLVAQVAPLLGLFGTVLGMIGAFRALQEAGSAVDPSALAGGIWVALLTTAAGLAVAMPVTAAVSWFESRIVRERAFAARAYEAAFRPMLLNA